MFDTLTLVAYLLGNEPGHSGKLHLQMPFLDRQTIACVEPQLSPKIRWNGVPPEASSLALIVKDAKKYYWVVYNLPVQMKGLPFAANQEIMAHDEGMNSWGKNSYHPWCSGKIAPPLTVELYALDKRFNAHQPMTGKILEEKIKGHVLAETVKKLNNDLSGGVKTKS